MTNPLIYIHAYIAGKTLDVYLRETSERKYEIIQDKSVQNVFKERVLPSLELGENIEEVLRGLDARNVTVQRSRYAQKAFEIDAYLKRMERDYQFTGTVLIKKRGEEFFCESYGNPNQDDSRYCIGSMSKMMTACAIMKMVQNPDIKLELDDRMNEHLPSEYRHPLFREITIRQLLNHTSGLPIFGSYEEDDKRTRLFDFDDLYKLTLLMCFIQKKN